LAKITVERPLDLAIGGEAKFEDGAETAGGADDVAVLSGGRGGPQSHQK
jgi:hypothetical protein